MSPRPDSSRPQHGHGPRGHDERPLRRRSGSDQDLIADLRRLDGRNYGAYKSVTGDWDYGDFSLAIDRVQSDPYAPPSSLRAIADPHTMGLPADCLATPDQRLAVADFLVRAFHDALVGYATSGDVHVVRVGQEVLQRSACTVTPERVEIRFQVRMPARGRTIQGGAAARIFDLDVPDTVMATFDFVSEDAAGRVEALRSHVHALEDHRALQEALTRRGWIAFVADGAVLARRSGISQKPMEDAVAFSSPESLRREVDLPHAGTVTGMALEPGVTVIVGGGYHGKSTLLGALQRGVYPHVPGDGRELVATLPDAMKVRAADGRAVTGVDVSAFINHLPGGADTTHFSTENASGSTSQAASVVEAVELGCPLLLIDEDTSATNLLIRDARMRELVHADKEPITPLVDRIGGLARERGVSTVMVMGGSGDYLDVADRVLMLDTYRCLDVTGRAREVCAAMPRERSDVEGFDEVGARTPLRARGGAERPRTKASGVDQVVLDRQTVDLSDVEQVVDPGQTEAIAWAMRGLLEDVFDGHTTLAEGLGRVEALVREQGLDGLTRYGARQYPAFLARPRSVDLGAALNRYRALRLA
ncbi:ABC-ATPase domain-containing protein [Actinomyces sp.]|uniref:ABC-ATPase domain-containing protein n=1 Tax=Actinomyces sp. TaxID=29317 RepID=UPI00289E34D2|nr:ABC-ATPase domain-containing protein [Actinomyces sp.]